MTAEDIKRIFENKLNEKIKNQKVIFIKNENEKPKNGSSKEIVEFLESLKDNTVMKKVVENTSNQAISLARERMQVSIIIQPCEIKKRNPLKPLKDRHFIAKILAKFIKIWYNFIKIMNKL